MLRAGALERRRPDPQGAALRGHELRGQPRRGRQGVLLLPRRDADPQLAELALQVSAVRVSVRRPRGDEPRAIPRRAGVRAHRHGRARRGAPVRRRRGVREGGAGRGPGADHRPQPGPRTSRAPPPSHALVPEHVVMDRRPRSPGPERRPPGTPVARRLRRPGRDALRPRRSSGARPALAGRRGRRPAPVHRERDEPRTPVRRAQRLTVREGRHQRRGRGRQGRCRQPRRDGNEGRGARARRHPGRRLDDRAPSPDRPRSGIARSCRRMGRRAVRAVVRGHVREPRARGRRVLRLDHAARRRRRAGEGHAPGARRDDLDEADLPHRHRALAGGPGARPVDGRPAPSGSGTPSGSTSSTTT